MSPPGAASTLAPAPPADPEALLARVAPERQKLFRLVRQLLDDLDVAARWDDLYYPPDDARAFVAMVAKLLRTAEGIPARITELVQLLSLAAPDDETRQTLEEAEFYFNGIHSMCAHDMQRLRGLLAPFATPDGARALAPADRNFLCEVAADVKGKYSSALMGATASIVGEGMWSGVEVEPILFPEKIDEFRRNADLLAALQRTLAAIGELREHVPFPQLVERWRAGARVDPYALADLATFRGILGQLLKRTLRRALYSGDYHQIQHRESALAVRIAELEAVHFHTWSISGADARTGSYPRLVQLTFEMAAVLDVELLEELVGGRALRDVRAAVTAESGGAVRTRALADELEPLVPLLKIEDLKTFLELLLGSVMKRASIAQARTRQPGGDQPRRSEAQPAAPAAPAPEAPTSVRDLTGEIPLQAMEYRPEPGEGEQLPSLGDLDDSFLHFERSLTDLSRPLGEHESPLGGLEGSLGDLEGSLADLDSTMPASTEVRPPSDLAAPGFLVPPQAERSAPPSAPPPVARATPSPPPVAPPPVAAAPPPAAPRPQPATPAVSPERRREAVQQLHGVLTQLQSPENAGWSSYRLLQRLLERHARIPPSMLQGAHPFVYDVLNNLVPQLESAAAVGAVPAEARRRLVECCLALTGEGITPEQMTHEVPANLSRLQRLLEGLQAATAAQLR